MFDANATYIPIGEFFFAEVHATNAELTNIGITRGDIVLCRHIIRSVESPLPNMLSIVWPNKDTPKFHRTGVSLNWSMLVYSGKPDGIGFISEHWRNKAKAFLGGQWQERASLPMLWRQPTEL